MTNYQKTYIDILASAWAKRQAKNSAYSLRALARDLEISPTGLSLILNQKRPLTIDRALVWADKLQLNELDKKNFIEAVTNESEERLNPNNRKADQLEEKIQYMQLRLDQFAIISDWYHLAMLNLTELKSFQSDPAWIASQLGITISETLEALSRLERLNLLEFKDDRYTRTQNKVSTPSDIPSEAIKNYHRQNIARALNSLDQDTVEDRDITSIVMPVDKKKLAEAKKMIRNFRREMAIFLESTEGDHIYSLNIQLFPQNTGEESA